MYMGPLVTMFSSGSGQRLSPFNGSAQMPCILGCMLTLAKGQCRSAPKSCRCMDRPAMGEWCGMALFMALHSKAASMQTYISRMINPFITILIRPWRAVAPECRDCTARAGRSLLPWTSKRGTLLLLQCSTRLDTFWTLHVSVRVLEESNRRLIKCRSAILILRSL